MTHDLTPKKANGIVDIHQTDFKEYNLNEHSNPIEYLINFAEKYGVDGFIINNARDELKKLKEQSGPYDLVGWARVNERGDLYDPRFCYNPYLPDSLVMPLYANKTEYSEKYGKSSK